MPSSVLNPSSASSERQAGATLPAELLDQVFDHLGRPSLQDSKALRAVSRDFCERVAVARPTLEGAIAMGAAKEAFGAMPPCCAKEVSQPPQRMQVDSPSAGKSWLDRLRPFRARRRLKEAQVRREELKRQQERQETALRAEQHARQASALPILIDHASRSKTLVLDAVRAPSIIADFPEQAAHFAEVTQGVTQLTLLLHKDDKTISNMQHRWQMAPQQIKVTSDHGDVDFDMFRIFPRVKLQPGPIFRQRHLAKPWFAHVVKLHLDRVSLPQSEEGSEAVLPQLKELTLSKNMLRHRDLALFDWAPFQTVETLHITDNLLDKMRLNLLDLRPLTQLRHLDLRDNNVLPRFLVEMAPMLPPSLETLSLDFNDLYHRIDMIPASSFPRFNVEGHFNDHWPLQPDSARALAAVDRLDEASQRRTAGLATPEAAVSLPSVRLLNYRFNHYARDSSLLTEVLNWPGLQLLRLDESLRDMNAAVASFRTIKAACEAWYDGPDAPWSMACMQLVVDEPYKDFLCIDVVCTRPPEALEPVLNISLGMFYAVNWDVGRVKEAWADIVHSD